jgi:hypothetical protein
MPLPAQFFLGYKNKHMVKPWPPVLSSSKVRCAWADELVMWSSCWSFVLSFASKSLYYHTMFASAMVLCHQKEIRWFRMACSGASAWVLNTAVNVADVSVCSSKTQRITRWLCSSLFAGEQKAQHTELVGLPCHSLECLSWWKTDTCCNTAASSALCRSIYKPPAVVLLLTHHALFNLTKRRSRMLNVCLCSSAPKSNTTVT